MNGSSGPIRSFLAGLALLRFPSLVRELGDLRFRIERIDALRSQGEGIRIANSVRLFGDSVETIRLGDRVSIGEGSILASEPVDDAGHGIEIGSDTWIGEYNNLRAGGGWIRLGRGCLVSQFCTLVASNHGVKLGESIRAQGAQSDRRGIVVGDDVWLGAGCAVMPGVTIGDGAVIGANSVVTSDVPAGEIWAGVPARRIGVRS
jgi:acetyltransferase-like isoleucine patch superfamily enzyme